MLTNDEANKLYEDLRAELRKRRDEDKLTERDDYLRAIEAEILAGKPVSITLQVRGEKEVTDPVAGKRQTEATSRAEFIQRQEYLPNEKLLILVNGLALATVAPPLMAQKFASTLASLDPNTTNSTLNMGDDQTTDPLLSLSTRSIADAVKSAEALRSLLDELRDELEPSVAARATKS